MNIATIPSSATTAGSTVAGWLMSHWLLSFLVLLLALLFFLLILLPLFFRLIRRRRNVVETTELKKDLMVWKNLASLVQGGEKGAAAKQTLSSQLGLIRILFRQGIGLLKDSRRKKYDVPWFILLGEPQSGKSTLLKNSDLELLCSVKQEMEQPEKPSSVPLCCWLGAKTFILDVAGRVFFDRWLEGSSAEWNYLIRLLNRFHHRRPLDGVILVVPADALLSDDESLTKQKASLIASELHQLLLRIGMNLPCHLVVTKMDMLLGFREYFGKLSREAREKIFGWQNPSANGKFPAETFHQYWQEMVEKLRDGCLPQLTDPEYFRNGDESRLDVCGRIYLFPDSVESVRRNLEIYLTHIFGEEGWRGNEQSLLSGVFFTSAEDRGVVLSNAFASLNGKRVEDAMLVGHPEEGEPRTFFIKNLLHDFIFPQIVSASFTARELFKRQIPVYLLSLGILLLGAGWLAAAIFRNNSFRENLKPITEYYNMIAEQFSDGNIAKSPLVAMNENNTPVFLTESEMTGNPRYTRLQFFYDAHNCASQPIHAPLGFKLAGFLDFGWNLNLGYPLRQYVFNQIQTEMVYLPTIKTLQKHLQNAKTEPFDRKKREAMFDYAEIVFSSEKAFQGFSSVSAFLLYLFPDINLDTVKLLTAYQRKYDWSRSDTAAKIIYDYDYANTQKKWFAHFFEAWKKLVIYEETLYPQVRNILQNGNSFSQAQEQIQTLAESMPISIPESGKMLAEWHRLLALQQKSLQQINQSIQRITGGSSLQLLQIPESAAGLTGEDSKIPGKSFYNLNLTQLAVRDYEKWIAEDKKEIFDYIDNSAMLLSGRGRESFFQMERQTADSLFSTVQSNLYQELAHLRKLHELLSKKHLLTKVKSETKGEISLIADSDLMVIDILNRLGGIAGQLNEVVPPKDLQGIQAAWQEQNSRIKAISVEFNDFAKQYAEIPEVVSAASAYRKLFQRQQEYNLFTLATTLLKLYPKNSTEFSSVIKAENTDGNVLKISPALSSESIGTIRIPSRYNPDAAMRLLEPYVQIRQFLTSRTELGEHRQFARALQLLPAVEKALKEYLEDYIKFWGGYADSLQRKMTSWDEFRKLCGTLKPYEVNTLLFAVYKNSGDILSRIPEAILTEDQKKRRTALLVGINARLQILVPHFSEICARQLSAWSLLPSSPEQAFRKLAGIPRKELLSDYLAVIATGRKSDIPWWSSLFQQGVELLKKNAGTQTLEKLNRNSDLFCFPLCADAVQRKILTAPELQKIRESLSMIGFPVEPKAALEKDKEEKNGGIASFGPLDLAGLMDRREQEWGFRLLEITDALTNRSKPLIWTLSLPSASQCRKLNESFFPGLPLASHRYRYVELFSDGKLKVERRSIDSAKTVVWARGDIADANLELRFFAFSTETKPVAVLRFRGLWPALRIYLTQGGYYDPEKKILYAPLIVRDKYDAPSVLWVALQFNKQLPQPVDWPSTQNSPDFSGIQKKVRSRRNLSVTDWSALIMRSRNYDTLKSMLLRHDLARYPHLEISTAAVPDNSAFFLQNRYMEFAVPGKLPIRVALGSGSRSLGTVELTCPVLKFRFYRHANDTVPSGEVEVPGPYAPLHLLTAEQRTWQESSFRVEYKCTINSKEEKIPLILRLME